MIVFTIIIMRLGYTQGDNRLLFFGFGLPLWCYLLYFHLKMISWIIVKTDYVTIKNIVFEEKNIYYKDIDQWEEIQTIRVDQRNLLLRVNGKKIVISNMNDLINYEILRQKLDSNFSNIKRKYN